ncbi:MAG: hypothetical protein H7A23_24730, partial [Leptospiraceae bacterium]|nr:hypothetical protein [Leptospiraceae bacterium]
GSGSNSEVWKAVAKYTLEYAEISIKVASRGEVPGTESLIQELKSRFPHKNFIPKNISLNFD